MIEFEILPSSPKLTETAKRQSKYNFPWSKLECGQSFSVPKESINLLNLRSRCSTKSKELKRKFKVAIHDTVYEVGRVE